VRELTDDEDVRAAAADHPLIGHLLPYRVPGGATAWASGAAVALRYDYWGSPSLMCVGPADDLRGLLDGIPRSEDHIAAPAAAAAAMPAGERFSWGFAWRDAPVGADPAAALWLADSDRDEINALLDACFPSASTRPSSPKARRWAGIRDESGRLVACIVDASGSPEVGFVASLAVATDQRGRGLGATLLGWTVDALLADHRHATLWYEGSNTHAIAIYRQLGFTLLPMLTTEP
jgi:ribosomal protein S18 acetylase RimI-like enzyme